MSSKLNEEGLQRLGWYNAGQDRQGNTMWRLKYPYYSFEFQMVLMDYPDKNPNCGILSLHNDEEMIPSWSKPTKKHPNGKPIEIKFKERTIPIAHHVITYNRLYSIIQSLTQVNL